MPSWVDIGSPDPQGAADFYGALFGWDAPEGPAETGGYRVAMVGDRAVAGIGEQQNPGPPVWATYIAVENADEAAAKVLAAGGQVIVPAMDVLDVGRMAVFTDPVGRGVLGVAGRHPPGRRTGQRAGHVVVERAAHHRRRGVEGVLRRRVRLGRRARTARARWASTPSGRSHGRSVGGMMQKPPMLPAEVPPFWAVYFAVADTDAAVARVAELGGSVVMPPMDIEPGRFATVADPFGGGLQRDRALARASPAPDRATLRPSTAMHAVG